MGQCIELFQMNERMDGLLVSVVGSNTHKRDGLVLTNYITQQSQFLAKGYGSCNDATWSYLDDRVVVVFDSGTVGYFPVLGGEPELWCGRTPVTDVACARTTQLTATGFRMGKLAWWDFRQGMSDPVAVCTHMRSDFNQISFSPDDTFLQASMEDNHVYVFDTRVLDRPLHCLAHEQAPRVMRVPCDSIGVTMSRWTRQGFLFSCGAEGTVKVWDMRGATQNALLKTLRSHCFSVSCVDVSPDGTLAASGCDGNRVALYSISYSSSVFPPMTDQHDPLAAQFGPLKLP